MISTSFTLPDKYANKKSQLQGLINSLNGEFLSTQIKDGTAYSIDFENDTNGSEFKAKLVQLIPDVHVY